MSTQHDIPPLFENTPGPDTMRITGNIHDPAGELTYQRFDTDRQRFKSVEKPQYLGRVATAGTVEALEPGMGTQPEATADSGDEDAATHKIPETLIEAADAAPDVDVRSLLDSLAAERTSGGGAEQAGVAAPDDEAEFVPHTAPSGSQQPKNPLEDVRLRGLHNPGNAVPADQRGVPASVRHRQGNTPTDQARRELAARRGQLGRRAGAAGAFRDKTLEEDAGGADIDPNKIN